MQARIWAVQILSAALRTQVWRCAVMLWGVAGPSEQAGVTRWTSVTDDPNDPAALAMRRKQLQVPYATVACRQDVILPICVGRRVLDVGCVDHSASGRARVGSLHADITQHAAEVVGVDLDAAQLGVLETTSPACAADATAPALPFRRASFDVVVAGEVIEHLDDVGGFLQNVRDVVREDGAIVLSTPNPYNTRRVRAGRRLDVTENVDHTIYVFPSGIAELASRHGLRIVSMACTAQARYSTDLLYSTRSLLAAVRRRLRGQRGPRWHLPLPYDYESPLAQLQRRWHSERAWHGETALYVLAHASVDGPTSPWNEREDATGS